MNSFHEFGSAATEVARRFAIVGAGPAGLYVAQALRQAEPGAEIDVIERLPSPYGLVRYGIAPDHQGTKAVIRQFERLFERQGVGFFGGVAVGRDVDLDELAGLYDAVILAAGLAGERRLGVPGEDLPGVIGAGAATRWFNSHPEHPEDCPPFGPRVAIIGAGNVAMDLARLLAKPAEAYRGSDFDPVRTAALAARGVRRIDVVGRSAPQDARFDPLLVKEIGELPGVRIEVRWPLDAGEAVDRDALARLAVLRALDGTGPADADRILTFRFGRAPERILGEDRVKAVVYSAADGSRETVPADCVITAIGFAPDAAEALLRRPADAVLPIMLRPGLFAAGWFRFGARGTIVDSRADGRAVARAVVETVAPGGRPGRAGLKRLLDQRRHPVVDFDAWRRIRALEHAAGGDERARIKVPTVADMMRLALADTLRDAAE